jgi:hypothetical protein
LAKNKKRSGRQKYSARPITLFYDGILTNGFFGVNSGTL